MSGTDNGTLQAIADCVGGALTGCDDAQLALALLHELALGEPVTAAAVAAAAARDEADVTARSRAGPTSSSTTAAASWPSAALASVRPGTVSRSAAAPI